MWNNFVLIDYNKNLFFQLKELLKLFISIVEPSIFNIKIYLPSAWVQKHKANSLKF